MNSVSEISLKSFMFQRQAYLLNWLATNGANTKRVGT
jgi:hypothetical protein